VSYDAGSAHRRAVVARVVHTRRGPNEPFAPGDRPADADLIVIWAATPIDVVDSPAAGRIGPVPFKRSGGHVHRGFFLAAGDGIRRASRWRSTTRSTSRRPFST
jgi:hypothetical protein